MTVMLTPQKSPCRQARGFLGLQIRSELHSLYLSIKNFIELALNLTFIGGVVDNVTAAS